MRWPDERLDDLAARLHKLESLPVNVALLESGLELLSREIRENTVATKDVSRQLEAAQMEPLTRSRNFRNSMVIALVGAVAGGGLALVGALAAAGGH